MIVAHRCVEEKNYFKNYALSFKVEEEIEGGGGKKVERRNIIIIINIDEDWF